jgi:hypothetical protein
MQYTSIPAKISTYWAQNASGSYVRTPPNTSQIGINAGYASWPDGFVPLNLTAEAVGGVPPYGQDMNGVLRAISQWLQFTQAFGGLPYDATFQTAISGYPQGAVVQSLTYTGTTWFSLIDNNTSNPDSGGDNWITIGDGARNDMKWRPTSESLPGWIIANGTTIGSASSGAAQLAAAKCAGVYAWLWNNFSNTLCPVTGGRGANASADFAANKTIAVLDMRGIAPVGADTMGGSTTTKLAGVPITTGGLAVATASVCTIAAATATQIEAGTVPAVLTVGGSITGTWAPGVTVIGSGVSAGTVIVSQASGVAGGAGTYNLNQSVSVSSSTAMTAYTAQSPGAVIGENTHVSTVQETAAHTHVQGTTGGNLAVGGGGNAASQFGTSATGITGGGLAHNNVSLALTGYWYLKL